MVPEAGVTARVGSTRDLVAAGGFREARGERFLVGADGTARFFLELLADPDHPAFRPKEAWASLLSALPPGWGLRALLWTWPDPAGRRAFREAAAGWPGPAELRAELLAFLESEPPPLRRRVILELAVPPAALAEAAAFREGIAALLEGFGVRAVPLPEAEVTELARRILHPRFDGGEG
jgi:hypothetical protein